MTRLAEPVWLWLVVLAPVPGLWGLRRGRIGWPTLAGFGGVRPGPARLLGAIPGLARGGAIACLALAMARPQVPGGTVRVAGRGVAIVALLDRSPSMNADDFPASGRTITRLEAARETLTRFVAGRGDDRIGLVAFANHPDLLAAPTLDHRFLAEAIASIRPAGPLDVGTSLGDAVAEGLGALRGLPPGRKVLVLLTDGRDEPAVPRPTRPEAAARLARDLGVTLHAIAVGRPSGDGATGEGPDLATLRRMAETTGGRAFQALDAGALGRVFAEVDRLEKSPQAGTVRTVYRERYAPWAAAALGLLGVDLALTSGRLRRLP